MDKKRITYMTMGFTIGLGVLLVMFLLLLAWSGHRRSGGIVLPESQSDAAGIGDEGQNSWLNAVSITPETVRSAISVLSRPTAYSRSQVVETFWSGGSGQSASQVYVSGARTRLDTTLPDGGTRHMLVEAAPGQTLAGVWYDDETNWTKLSSRALTADQAGRMLTYETVRDLPPESIALADYRQAYGEDCIYVETRPDEAGYLDRYWVSVGSGLLVGAERLWGEDVVYRFSAAELEIAPQEDDLFLLPDGGVLAGK